ncbi:MAG: sigma-70 family RNA polymerase sigma factor [Acidimicrobiia bacterium]|nr:sigma-70 family RNA polymerase sigma factor [Acidimicrobiia bacterium]
MSQSFDAQPGWPPDRSSVEAARFGDRAALADILTAGHPRLVAFFRGAGPPWADADDLAAHTCEAVVKSIDKLRNPAAFEGWFWQIARLSLRGWIRKNRRPRRLPPGSVAPREPDEAFFEAEEHDLIRAALAMMSTKERELLWLREVEGLSYEEIGGRLGAATGTVRVACHRARKRLEVVYLDLEPPTGATDAGS